jgi:hypothetical protein
MIRILRLLLPVALVVLAMASATTTASAYGKSDQPLAQVEVSANCDNPSIGICQPPPAGFGLGGIWVWVEIDANGSADISGAACGHGGPFSGASSIHFTGSWLPFHGTANDLYTTFGPPPAFFVAAVDPNNNYYVLPQLGLAVPQTQGHYGTRLAPGAQVQVTIAP